MTRWRLVLGRFAEKQLQGPLSAREARMEAALDFLYSREYNGRGVRKRPRRILIGAAPSGAISSITTQSAGKSCCKNRDSSLATPVYCPGTSFCAWTKAAAWPTL